MIEESGTLHSAEIQSTYQTASSDIVDLYEPPELTPRALAGNTDAFTNVVPIPAALIGEARNWLSEAECGRYRIFGTYTTTDYSDWLERGLTGIVIAFDSASDAVHCKLRFGAATLNIVPSGSTG
jgi:hypothetical protein